MIASQVAKHQRNNRIFDPPAYLAPTLTYPAISATTSVSQSKSRMVKRRRTGLMDEEMSRAKHPLVAVLWQIDDALRGLGLPERSLGPAAFPFASVPIVQTHQT